jgi:hypothetical protein
MPINQQTDSCISTERGALVFWAPGREPKRQGSRVQIVDVFALQVATGYTRDPQASCSGTPSPPWQRAATGPLPRRLS